MDVLNIDMSSIENKLYAPKKLVTISVAALLNEIEKDENKNIYMLKNQLSQSLFEIIERTTLSKFNVVNLNSVNLETLKNVLSSDIFEQNVQIYLNTVVEESIHLDIFHIRDNVPEYIYRLFLNEYLKDESCWKFVLENTFDMKKDDIFTLLDSSTMTAEEYFLLTNIPDRIYNNIADEIFHVAIKMWKFDNDLTNSTYCENCIKTKEDIYKRTEVITSYGDELIRDELRNPKHWCSECLFTTVLTIIKDFSTFVDY